MMIAPMLMANIKAHGIEVTPTQGMGSKMDIYSKIVLDVFANLASQEGVCCVNCNDVGCAYCGPADVLGAEYEEWLDLVESIEEME